MENIKLKVLKGPTKPEPWDHSAFTLFTAKGGDVTYICGTCDHPIAKGFQRGALQNKDTITCPACGSHLGAAEGQKL